MGAGIGSTTRSLCSAEHASWTCIEPDSSLRAGFELEASRGPFACPVTLWPGTTDSLDERHHFDTVLYIDVIEHIEDDRAELARAGGLLRRGGRIVVLAPAHSFLYSRFDEAIGHYRRYTAKALRSIFPSAMAVEHWEYLDSLGMGLSLANRVLLRQSSPTARQIRFWDRMIVPCSRVADALSFRRLGKSVLVVARAPE